MSQFADADPSNANNRMAGVNAPPGDGAGIAAQWEADARLGIAT